MDDCIPLLSSSPHVVLMLMVQNRSMIIIFSSKITTVSTILSLVDDILSIFAEHVKFVEANGSGNVMYLKTTQYTVIP